MACSLIQVPVALVESTSLLLTRRDEGRHNVLAPGTDMLVILGMRLGA